MFSQYIRGENAQYNVQYIMFVLFPMSLNEQPAVMQMFSTESPQNGQTTSCTLQVDYEQYPSVLRLCVPAE